MTSRSYAAKDIDIDLRRCGRVLRRRWPLILTAAVTTTVAAALYASSQEDTYQAEAKLLVERSDQVSELIGLENGSRELKALASQSNPLDTQVEIFRSIPIAQQVIDRLNIRDGEGQRIDPETLLQDLSVSPIPGTDVLRISYEHPSGEFAAGVVNAAIAIYLESNVQASRLDATTAQTFIATQLPASESQVKAAELALRQFKEANGVVELETESRNTVEVLATLNSTVTSLKAQLADASARATNLQRQLQLNPAQAYAAGIVSESPGVQTVLFQLQEVQTQLALASTRYRPTHPEVANLRSQIAALNAMLNRRVAQAAGADLAALPTTDLQSGQLEQNLIAQYLQLESQRAGLAQQLEQMAAALAAQRSRAQAMPNLEAQERELSRKLVAAQGTYETLLESLQQAQVIQNQNLENARIVSPALVPTQPLGTSTLLYLLAGGAAGTLLGIMLAFIADFLNRSIETVQEAQSLYDYPLLGTLPAWKKISPKDLEAPQLAIANSHIANSHTANSHVKSRTTSQTVPLAESYQSLQANLKFSCFDEPLKSIAITSAVAGEGKSEVAANLALTLAQLGHKVLVIDADMRSPAQQHIWGLAEPQGLSNFVAGQISLKQAVVRCQPNLHVISVGSIPPNPLAVLESARMAKLIQACEETYDYLILDTPSILGLADVPTVGRLVDGLLLVVQTDICDRDSIKAAKLALVQSKQRVLGIVANGIKIESRQDRYFYHPQEWVDRSTTLLVHPIAERLAESMESLRLIRSKSRLKERNLQQKDLKQKDLEQKDLKQEGLKQKDLKQEGLNKKELNQKNLKKKGFAKAPAGEIATSLQEEATGVAVEQQSSLPSIWKKSGRADCNRVNRINAATATIATVDSVDDT